MSAGGWHVVARGRDVPAGHLFHTRLHGLELVVWRDDAGRLNAWENRCPHRSVRLTIGQHLGNRLKCRYHGWEFGAQGGGLLQVPAHPADAPPARIAVRTFPIVEAHGLAWVTTHAQAAPPDLGLPADHAALLLRAVRFECDVEAALDALVKDAGNAPVRERIRRMADGHLVVARPDSGEYLHYLLQPADTVATIVHGLHGSPRPVHDPLTTLRAHDDRLVALRDALEAHGTPGGSGTSAP